MSGRSAPCPASRQLPGHCASTVVLTCFGRNSVVPGLRMYRSLLRDAAPVSSLPGSPTLHATRVNQSSTHYTYAIPGADPKVVDSHDGDLGAESPASYDWVTLKVFRSSRYQNMKPNVLEIWAHVKCLHESYIYNVMLIGELPKLCVKIRPDSWRSVAHITVFIVIWGFNVAHQCVK